VDNGESRNRKAPYAPISSLEEFFARIRNVAAPPLVDRKFIQKLNVASNNEWALLSALKYLGVIDDRGEPTSAYRLLQTTDRFEEALQHLVLTAYAPLIEVGGLAMSTEDLENYFRVTSSASQARNAARFFSAVCRMSGIQGRSGEHEQAPHVPTLTAQRRDHPSQASLMPESIGDEVLRAKAHLLEKLPAPRPDWSAEQYAAICEKFLQMLRHLDTGETASAS
jgi:hypothetical protein